MSNPMLPPEPMIKQLEVLMHELYPAIECVVEFSPFSPGALQVVSLIPDKETGKHRLLVVHMWRNEFSSLDDPRMRSELQERFTSKYKELRRDYYRERRYASFE